MFETLARIVRNYLRTADGRGGPTHRATGPESTNTYVPDEVKVLQRLESSEGYMWQRQIAHELGWTPSKTSRVLGGLEDEGTVIRQRIGRQKAVFLPEDMPGGVRDDTTVQISGRLRR